MNTRLTMARGLGMARRPGGPSERLAIALIALGIAATIGVYSCMRIPRSVLFWSAFVLSGTVAALGGHVVLKSIERSTQNAGASCRLSAISLKPQQSNRCDQVAS